MAWSPEPANHRSPHGWVVTNDPDHPGQLAVQLPRRRPIWYMTLDLRFTAVVGGPITLAWVVRLDPDSSTEAYTVDVSYRPVQAIEPVVLLAPRELRWSDLVRFRGTGWFYVVADEYDLVLDRPSSVTVQWHNKQALQHGLWFKCVLAMAPPLLAGAFPPERTVWLRPALPAAATPPAADGGPA